MFNDKKETNTNKEINTKKILIIEIAIFFAIRFPLLFIEHLWAAAEPCRNMVQGNLPYCNFEGIGFDFGVSTHIFPPILYYLHMLEYLIIGNLVEVIHPMFIFFEFFNVILCYKLLLIYHNKEDALIGIFLLIFFPISIVLLAFFTPVVYATTFLLASIYFFEKDKLIFSSIFAALATASNFIPGIILLPFFIYYVKNKRYQSFVYFLAVFMISLILLCLPFLLSCPQKFFDSILLSINTPQSSNISYILFGDVPQQVIIKIFFINIKMINLVQITVLLFFFFFFIKKYQNMKKRDVMILTIFFINLIEVLTLYLHPRFDYFTFLIIIILIPYGYLFKTSFFNKKLFLKIFIIAILYIIMSTFCLIYSWNFEIYLNVINHMNLLLLYFFLFSILYFIIIILIFNKVKLIQIALLYQNLAVYSIILYKLLYEYGNVIEFNLFLSYFCIGFILFLNYVLSFKFLLIDISKSTKYIYLKKIIT